MAKPRAINPLIYFRCIMLLDWLKLAYHNHICGIWEGGARMKLFPRIGCKILIAVVKENVTPMNDAISRQLTDDLLALGVQRGGVLLVHSSLRSLGAEVSRANQGAETVVLSLLAALGDTGTLLMPALSYESVSASSPLFDVCNTP